METRVDHQSPWQWALLFLIGGLAGLIRALRAWRRKSSAGDMVVSLAEFCTALLVTWIVAIALGAFLPVKFPGLAVPMEGYIAVGGGVAHIGLRAAIKFLLRFAHAEPD